MREHGEAGAGTEVRFADDVAHGELVWLEHVASGGGEVVIVHRLDTAARGERPGPVFRLMLEPDGTGARLVHVAG